MPFSAPKLICFPNRNGRLWWFSEPFSWPCRNWLVLSRRPIRQPEGVQTEMYVSPAVMLTIPPAQPSLRHPPCSGRRPLTLGCAPCPGPRRGWRWRGSTRPRSLGTRRWRGQRVLGAGGDLAGPGLGVVLEEAFWSIGVWALFVRGEVPDTGSHIFSLRQVNFLFNIHTNLSMMWIFLRCLWSTVPSFGQTLPYRAELKGNIFLQNLFLGLADW